MAIYFLAPRVGYFAHMDLKQKWSGFFLNQCQLAVLPLMSVFIGVTDPKPNLNGKKNIFLKNKSSLGSYQPNL